MKKFLTKLAVGLAALSFISIDAEACTIMLVTKGASTDGSVFVSHSNDGFGLTRTSPSFPRKITSAEVCAPFISVPPLRIQRRLVISPKSSTLTPILTAVIPA